MQKFFTTKNLTTDSIIQFSIPHLYKQSCNFEEILTRIRKKEEYKLSVQKCIYNAYILEVRFMLSFLRNFIIQKFRFMDQSPTFN